MKLDPVSLSTHLSRKQKQLIFVFIDILIFALSIYLAFILRFDTDNRALLRWWRKSIYLIYLIFPVKLVCFWFIGVYRPVLKYMGSEFLTTITFSVITSSGLLALLGVIFRITLLPRSIFILDAIITLLLVTSARVGIRWILYQSFAANVMTNNSCERVIIYGVGEAGAQLAKALSSDSRYKVVGFVDEDPMLNKYIVSGIKVHSSQQLPKLVEKHKVQSILLAVPKKNKQQKLKIIKGLQKLGVSIKTVPRINEIVSGQVSISELRNIDIVDLLGREEITPLPELMEKNIRDKVVLVTGAGGSIGSELCRQIVQQSPSYLILYELNEFALYTIDSELKEEYSSIKIIACLGSVTDSTYFEIMLERYSVETIYHAAAYKHVPLIESNISRGVLNNIIGTLTCIKAAIKNNIETVVLISTDKAVRPTNVMGATKRISEMILQAASQNSNRTKLVIVRFGNVLDSAGSVVPLFRKQIREGKNLNVTHKDIERYFMSIPEAARLVIQAGALGTGGDVFLLEMGEPVKIYDLARQMIELSGLKPGEDIDIEIRGLRPGEKLFEELFLDDSKRRPTLHPKIYRAEESFLMWGALMQKLDGLVSAAEEDKTDKVLAELKTIVPEFNHSCN